MRNAPTLPLSASQVPLLSSYPLAYHKGVTRPRQSRPVSHLQTAEPAGLRPMAPEPVRRASALERVLGYAAAGAAGFVLISLLAVASLVSLLLGYGGLSAALFAALLLLLGGAVVASVRVAQQGLRRRAAPASVPAQVAVPDPAAARRELVRLQRYAARLPLEARPALQAALAAADEALAAAAPDPLSRDYYEAHQAAMHDLPQLLELYTRSGGALEDLTSSLELIAAHLRGITARLQEERRRAFRAQQEYLGSKYAADPLEGDSGTSDRP